LEKEGQFVSLAWGGKKRSGENYNDFRVGGKKKEKISGHPDASERLWLCCTIVSKLGRSLVVNRKGPNRPNEPVKISVRET